MNARPRQTAKSFRRPLLHGLVLLGLLPKFFVPLGYMPAAIGEGGPLVLCESFGVVAGEADHAHSHDSMSMGEQAPDQDGDHSQWERCSLGGLATLAAITTSWDVAVTLTNDDLVTTTTPAQHFRLHRSSFQPRAPPVV